MIDVFPVLIILTTGILSGMFGTLAGGSGLIGIPVLIILGFSPQTAIGTFFFGVTGMNLAGWYGFHRKQFIDYRIGLLVAIPTFAGAILGATIVARHAGEMISEISLAIGGNLGLKTLSNVIHTYPTQAEAIKQVADAYNRTRLTPFIKGMFTRWLAWKR